jgi:hypothetical protein
MPPRPDRTSEDVADDEFPVVLAFGVLLQLRVLDRELADGGGKATDVNGPFLPRMVRSVSWPGTTMGELISRVPMWLP